MISRGAAVSRKAVRGDQGPPAFEVFFRKENKRLKQLGEKLIQEVVFSVRLLVVVNLPKESVTALKNSSKKQSFGLQTS